MSLLTRLEAAARLTALASGLVLFGFAVMELCNDAIGLISLEVMGEIAAWRMANSSKLVVRHPKIVWMIGDTCASLPLRRSAKSSARASAVYGGTPAASWARFASSGVTFTYWIVFPVAAESFAATSAIMRPG